MNQISFRLLLLLGLGCLQPAFACSVSATPLVFGAIDPLVAAPTDSAAEVFVTCPAHTEYSIQLSSGNGSYLARYLVSGAHRLYYNLYADASRFTIWGDGSGGSATVAGSADSTGSTHTIHGRIPHDSTAVPGSYGDTIIVTISY